MKNKSKNKQWLPVVIFSVASLPMTYFGIRIFGAIMFNRIDSNILLLAVSIIFLWPTILLESWGVSIDQLPTIIFVNLIGWGLVGLTWGTIIKIRSEPVK